MTKPPASRAAPGGDHPAAPTAASKPEPAPGRRGSARRSARLTTLVKVIVGALITAWTLIPLYWALVISVSPATVLQKSPVALVPSSVTLQNFVNLLDRSQPAAAVFQRALANSVIEALGTTVVTLLVAVPGAYAFARLRTRAARASFLVVIFTLAVPVYFVLIPLFRFAATLGQINTYQGVILVLASASLPLSVWILRSHIAAMPADLEDAARLDGASTLTLITKIIGPLIAPGIVAAGIVTFLAAWGAFLIPLVFANEVSSQPVTVLIPQYTSRYAQDYGLQAAAAVLAVLPPVVLVLWLRRYLVSGLLAGASR